MAVLRFPFDPDKFLNSDLSAIDELRAAIYENGWQPVPVQTGQKRPDGFRWQALNGPLPPAIVRAKSTGILASGLRAIDVDIDDPDVAVAIEKMVNEIAGETPLIRHRAGSPRIMAVYRAPDGTTPEKATAILPGGRVEILGRGQQFVAFGTHPDGNDYEWRGHSPATMPKVEAPVLSPEIEDALMKALQSVFGAQKAAPSPSSALQKPAENKLPRPAAVTASSGDFWRRVNDAAFADLDAWVTGIFPSARGSNQGYRIKSRDLGRDRQEDLSITPAGAKDFGEHDMGDPRGGARSAIDLVEEWGGAPDAKTAAFWLCERLGRSPSDLGWQDQSELAREGAEIVAGLRRTDTGNPKKGEAGIPVTEQFQRVKRELPFVIASSWAGRTAPKRDWLVEGWVPAHKLTLITGEGATGKSTIGLQLCVAVATGGVWMGERVPRGRALFVTSEDEFEEVERRLDAIEATGDVDLVRLDDLGVVSLENEDAVLAEPNQRTGRLAPTALFTALTEKVAEWQPTLLILDPIADLFGGNENDKPQVIAFIKMCKGLMKENPKLTVVLFGHPSVSGVNTGTGTSGNVAWSNSVRSRLYFTRVRDENGNEPDTDVRMLSNMKQNYSKQGGKLYMRWTDGRFLVEDGAIASALDAQGERDRIDDLFLSILSKLEAQNRYVNGSSGASYAPNVFARDQDAGGVGKRAFAAAMGRLYDAGLIRNVEYGPPSKRSMRITRASKWDLE